MIDAIQRFICTQQQELFEFACEESADMEEFIPSFMRSDFCNRSLDKPYSVDQFDDIYNWLDFLEKDCRIISAPLQKHPMPRDVAGWLGFVYRHLQIETGLPSREIIDRVPVRKLQLSYEGLHTVDEEMAVEIISEDFGLPLKQEYQNN